MTNIKPAVGGVNIGSLAEKLKQIKAKQAEAAQQRREELTQAANAAVEEANRANAKAMADDPHFVKDGVANIPSNWWGAERDRMVEALGTEIIEEFNSNMAALLTSTKGNIAEASARLQMMLKTHSGSEILLNPAIMKAIVEKLQSGYITARRASIDRQSAIATKKVATAQASDVLDQLLGDM